MAGEAAQGGTGGVAGRDDPDGASGRIYPGGGTEAGERGYDGAGEGVS